MNILDIKSNIANIFHMVSHVFDSLDLDGVVSSIGGNGEVLVITGATGWLKSGGDFASDLFLESLDIHR